MKMHPIVNIFLDQSGGPTNQPSSHIIYSRKIHPEMSDCQNHHLLTGSGEGYINSIQKALKADQKYSAQMTNHLYTL